LLLLLTSSDVVHARLVLAKTRRRLVRHGLWRKRRAGKTRIRRSCRGKVRGQLRIFAEELRAVFVL
jgi:hypothetical protein